MIALISDESIVHEKGLQKPANSRLLITTV